MLTGPLEASFDAWIAWRCACASPAPTHSLSDPSRAVWMKNTESFSGCDGLLSGTSREASSATSPTTRLYRASLGVRSATSPSTSTSPLSHASLRRWMSFATKRSRKTKTTKEPQKNASVAHMEMRHAALRTECLPVLEDITHPSQGPDQRCLSVAVDLTAKAVD